MNSNDIKWNRIKAIEKELAIVYNYYDYVYSNYSFEVSDKIAKKEVWILANKILEIASPVHTDYQKILLDKKANYWTKTPITWLYTLKKINRLSIHYIYSDFYKEIENAWAEYDYANS